MLNEKKIRLRKEILYIVEVSSEEKYEKKRTIEQSCEQINVKI